MENKTNELLLLTEDEANLYDRQIRLWGIEAQRRIRSANVLLVGVNGLSAEISKNLVLAGIKSLTISDNGKVTDADLVANFLLHEESVGQSKVLAIRDRLAQLNPLVELETIETVPTDLSPFSVVCTTIFDLEQVNRLGECCRKFNVKFFVGCTWGSCGFMFEDLIEHHYVKESKLVVEGNAPKKSAENDSETRKFIQGHKRYVSLANALNYKWDSDLKSQKRLRNMPKTYFVLLTFIEFYKRHKRLPIVDDFEELKEIASTCLSHTNAELPDEYLSNVYDEFPPVCAVTGGIISQEITKVVSGFDEPLDNFFFFDSITCTGISEHIGTDTP